MVNQHQSRQQAKTGTNGERTTERTAGWMHEMAGREVSEPTTNSAAREQQASQEASQETFSEQSRSINWRERELRRQQAAGGERRRVDRRKFDSLKGVRGHFGL